MARLHDAASRGNCSGGCQTRAHVAAVVADNSDDESFPNPSVHIRPLNSVTLHFGAEIVPRRWPSAALVYEISHLQDFEEMHKRAGWYLDLQSTQEETSRTIVTLVNAILIQDFGSFVTTLCSLGVCFLARRTEFVSSKYNLRTTFVVTLLSGSQTWNIYV